MARRRSRYVFTQYRETHRVRNFFMAAAAVVLTAAVILLSFNFAVSRQVRLERQTITLTNLPVDLENWTILHFSDLHGQRYGSEQSGIGRVVSQLNVSSIVFTGDMVGADGDVRPLLELVALLPVDKPKLMVLGDEDPAYLDPTAHGNLTAKADWALKLEEAGVTILDRPVMYARGKNDRARIWFVPEDVYSLDLDALEMVYQGQADRLSAKGTLTPDEAAQKRVAEYQVQRAAAIRQAKRDMLATDVQVVLSHAPVTQDTMSALIAWTGDDEIFSMRKASVILSGHYCGGQWRLPGVGALYTPDYGWFPPDETVQGLVYLSGVAQYTSPGLGASGAYPYMRGRLLNPPTVALVTLSARMQ